MNSNDNNILFGSGIKGKKKKGLNVRNFKKISNFLSFKNMRKYIRNNYYKYKWDNIKIENKCIDEIQDLNKKSNRIIKFNNTQKFISNYFNPSSPYKGLLLWHSVGTGKTCSAISIASNKFEEEGYTILWVTRHTLKPDIWKNMFNSVCSIVLQNKIKEGINIPKGNVVGPLKYLSKSWMMPISYKQFSNLLAKKNKIYNELVKINGSDDILKKTLIIIDEAHKLFSKDLPLSERPNIKILKEKIKYSYEKSKENSVKLLLMTATPFTNEPMDLIKLINLMKEEKHEIPENLENFKEKYLKDDDSYDFTDEGKIEYLNDITGYISYLNRDKDARQFAIPNIEDIYVDMTYTDIEKIKKEINETTDKNIKKELKKSLINNISQEVGVDKCLGLKEKIKKDCSEDKELNPKTGKCIKKCKENQIRDPNTGRCIKKK